MFFKKIKNIIAIIIVATFIMPQTLLAYSEYIVAGGENIGLQINNNGIIVAGFYKINGNCPFCDAKLNKGDIITKANGNNVSTINDFINVIKNSKDEVLTIEYLRNKKKNTTKLTLVKEDNILKTGLYVKDMVSGIGTLTFIDPNTKYYGALGHEVVESSSGIMLDVKDGKIFDSSVTSIDKSERGEPGYKNANIDSKTVYGNIKENTSSGIFGSYTNNINKDKLYKVGTFNDIKLGEAKILTVINKQEKKEYKINIIKVNNDKNDNKNILFDITDNELINKTGGIIQGMSGSPIIQGDMIIGAVTNVVVNNPKRGYGILITTMLKEAEN